MISQLKLKEFMYLSLLGEYTYMEMSNNHFIICFTGSKHFCFEVVKPLCLTSTDFFSDKTVTQRICKFENKVLKSTSVLHKKQLEKDSTLNLDNRIKYFVQHYYNNDLIYETFKENMYVFKACKIISDTQEKAAISYVNKLRDKMYSKENSLN